MRGSSVLQEMLDEMPQSEVRVFVVWQSILASDWTRPGGNILGRVRDTRARQYWDAENVFPQQLGERMRSDPTHPQPSCCETDDGVPWDLAAIYPSGARWEQSLPAATYIDGPVFSVKPELATALAELEKGSAQRKAQ